MVRRIKLGICSLALIAGLSMGGALAAPPEKVEHCHQVGNGSYVLLSIPHQALDQQGHGEVFPVDGECPDQLN